MTLEHCCGQRVWVDFVRVGYVRIPRFLLDGKAIRDCPVCEENLARAYQLGELKTVHCEEVE